MSDREYRPTVADWRPAAEPPEVREGTAQSVIVARKSDKGRWYVFGAMYLNKYPLVDVNEDDSDEMPWTGFHTDSKHDDYDQYCEPIDVLAWAPMPAPPDDAALADLAGPSTDAAATVLTVEDDPDGAGTGPDGGGGWGEEPQP